MIKGLAITPPILGRISIGKVVEKNGKRIPEKDDQFTITSQIQNKDSGWVKHPLDEQLRAKAPNQKLYFDSQVNEIHARVAVLNKFTESGRPHTQVVT